MRIPGRAALSSAAVLLAVGFLVGCSGSGDKADPAPKPSVTPTPVFTSDAEALAAATEAYKRYLAVSDEISRDGGKDPQRIDAVATGDARALSNQNASDYRTASAHMVGETRASGIGLQRWESSKKGVVVLIYACEDLRQVSVVDAQDHSITSETREVYSPYQVVVRGTLADSLKVDKLIEWSGGGICPA